MTPLVEPFLELEISPLSNPAYNYAVVSFPLRVVLLIGLVTELSVAMLELLLLKQLGALCAMQHRRYTVHVTHKKKVSPTAYYNLKGLAFQSLVVVNKFVL